jgi:hypothetical protein
MRAGGYYIGNVLAAIDTKEITEQPGYSDLFNQILIEKFLMAADDGWILRKARYYRGAFQAENEAATARRLLMGLLDKKIWIQRALIPVRAGMNLLPHGIETPTVAEVRQHSLALSKKDRQFMPLRVKIHNQPGAEDAKSVREYAAKVKDGQLASEYEHLAANIDKVYASDSIGEKLEKFKKKVRRYSELVQSIDKAVIKLETSKDPGIHLAETGRLMAEIRDRLLQIKGSGARFAAINMSLALEAEHFKASAALKKRLKNASRGERLDYLQSSICHLRGRPHIGKAVKRYKGYI